MALPYELLIGLRYTRAKRRNHFISFISLISMLGIGLGVAALIVVLSVMNGFQKELRTRILGVASHIQITGISGELSDWPAVAAQAAEASGGRGARPFVQSQAMFTVDGRRSRGRWCAASCRTRKTRSPISRAHQERQPRRPAAGRVRRRARRDLARSLRVLSATR
jgi:ABC-type lipoprotein release transport system permease subunit